MSLVTWLEERVSRSTVAATGLVLTGINLFDAFHSGEFTTFAALYAVLPPLAFFAAGFVLWGRHRISVYLILVGVAWVIGTIQGTNVALFVGLGVWFGDLFRVVIAHTALAYPEGRLRDGISRVIVGIGYGFIVIVGLIRVMAFLPYEYQSCECPRNALGVIHSERFFTRIDEVYGIIGAVLELLVIVLLLRLFLRAGNGERRLRAPWLVNAGAFALLLAVDLYTRLNDVSPSTLDWLYFFVHLGLVAAAISYPLALRREQPVEVAAPEPAPPLPT